MAVLARVGWVEGRFAQSPVTAPGRQHADKHSEFFRLVHNKVYVTKICLIGFGGVTIDKWQITIRIRNGQPAELRQDYGLNYREALLRTIRQILRGFLAVQAMKQFPGSITQVEEWLATLILKVTTVGRDF